MRFSHDGVKRNRKWHTFVRAYARKCRGRIAFWRACSWPRKGLAHCGQLIDEWVGNQAVAPDRHIPRDHAALFTDALAPLDDLLRGELRCTHAPSLAQVAEDVHARAIDLAVNRAPELHPTRIVDLTGSQSSPLAA